VYSTVVSAVSLGNESVPPKSSVNDTINLFSRTAVSISVISYHNSFLREMRGGMRVELTWPDTAAGGRRAGAQLHCGSLDDRETVQAKMQV